MGNKARPWAVESNTLYLKHIPCSFFAFARIHSSERTASHHHTFILYGGNEFFIFTVKILSAIYTECVYVYMCVCVGKYIYLVVSFGRRQEYPCLYRCD